MNWEDVPELTIEGRSRRLVVNTPDTEVRPGSKWITRFQNALQCLTGAWPPLMLCKEWLADDGDRLQSWVNEQPGTPGWVQGIAIIDAAKVLANQPVEGDGHEPLFDEDWTMNDQDKKVSAPATNAVDPW